MAMERLLLERIMRLEREKTQLQRRLDKLERIEVMARKIDAAKPWGTSDVMDVQPLIDLICASQGEGRGHAVD